MTVVINGRDDFTLENYRRVAEGGEPVVIGPRAREAMAAARADFIRLLESDRTQFIYGVTSSFGPRAKVTIPPEQQLAHARGFEFRGNWARGFGGGYLDERVVRGIIFARLANFVAGNSKARPVIAERLAALLDDPLPPVPLDGEVGAGEGLPLAHVLRGFRLDDIEEGEANPVTNGSPVSAALAADAA
ncbi:MAG: aromatic amino acid lyase, partial [Mycobacterium sp.]